METLVSGGMSDFLNAFYRQQQQSHLLKYQPNGYYDDKNKLKVSQPALLLTTCGYALFYS